jgi:hypothetical protein
MMRTFRVSNRPGTHRSDLKSDKMARSFRQERTFEDRVLRSENHSVAARDGPEGG